MEKGMPENNSVLSELKLEHVVFDMLSFQRIGFRSAEEREQKIKVGASVDKLDDGKYRVSLKVQVEQEEEYITEVQVSGFCTINEDCAMKDEILHKNTVAILFPYVRSQLTLLTAQPETTPIVLPALNINALIENAE